MKVHLGVELGQAAVEEMAVDGEVKKQAVDRSQCSHGQVGSPV